MTNKRVFSFALAAASLVHTPASHAQATAASNVRVVRWSGVLRPKISNRLDAKTAEVTRYTGGVNLVQPRAEAPDYLRIEINVSSTGGSELMEWALLPARCGSAVMPLLQAADVPPIQVPSGGNGEQSFEVSLKLDPAASYHLDIYHGGHSQNNLVACADLRFQKPGK